MSWRQMVRRQAGKGVAAISVVVMVAMFAASFLFLFTGRVHGSGTGCLGLPGCPPPNQCPQVLFVAATGSSEYPVGDDLSVSPELNAVFGHMIDTLSTIGVYDVGIRVLPYSAASVDVLTSKLKTLKFDSRGLVFGTGYLAAFGVKARDAMASGISEYLASERGGVSSLTTLFSSERSMCGATKFVLAGYSQGAMVVHDFLNQLAATHNSADQASIIGTVLLGDPYRTRFSGVHELGDASGASYGICDTLNLAVHCAQISRLQDVARTFQPHTVSVCAYDDLVCDTSNFVPDLGSHFYLSLAAASSFINLSLAIHGSYTYIQPAAVAGELMARYVAASV